MWAFHSFGIPFIIFRILKFFVIESWCYPEQIFCNPDGILITYFWNPRVIRSRFFSESLWNPDNFLLLFFVIPPESRRIFCNPDGIPYLLFWNPRQYLQLCPPPSTAFATRLVRARALRALACEDWKRLVLPAFSALKRGWGTRGWSSLAPRVLRIARKRALHLVAFTTISKKS